MDTTNATMVVIREAAVPEEHTFRQEFLYALAPQAVVANHLRTQAIGLSQDHISEILAEWSLLQPTVQALIAAEAGLPDTITTDPVPAGLAPKLTEYVEDPVFRRQFNIPFAVEMVEIDKLVAFQWVVNADYVERLMERFGAAPTDEDLLRICVSPQREMEPVLHLELNPQTHSFSSRNSDVRFLGSFIHEVANADLANAEVGGVPTAAIIAFVGYGAPMVNALQVGPRIILNNGFHRVVALRRLGVERIPIVVQQVTNPHLEVPPALGGLPKEYFINDPRPPVVKDFFTTSFTLDLNVRERVKLVNLAIQIGDQEVPA